MAFYDLNQNDVLPRGRLGGLPGDIPGGTILARHVVGQDEGFALSLARNGRIEFGAWPGNNDGTLKGYEKVVPQSTTLESTLVTDDAAVQIMNRLQAWQQISFGGAVKVQGRVPKQLNPPYYDTIDGVKVFRYKSYTIDGAASSRYGGAIGDYYMAGRLDSPKHGGNGGWFPKDNANGRNYWEIDLAEPQIIVGSRIQCTTHN